MLRFQRKRLQDEQIRHSLWKVDTVRVGHALPFRFYKEHTRSLVEVQGEPGAWVATVQYSRVRASFSAARNRIALSPIESAIWAQGIVCVPVSYTHLGKVAKTGIDSLDTLGLFGAGQILATLKDRGHILSLIHI